MKIMILLAMLSIPASGGLAATWLWAKRRERGTIASRLARLVPKSAGQSQSASLLKKTEGSLEPEEQFSLSELAPVTIIRELLAQSSMEQNLSAFFAVVLALFILPIAIAILLGFSPLLAAFVGLALAAVPYFVLKSRAGAQRTKFCEQLPDAIDLMVAILRSGHSVSQAVKAVAQDLPNPCGEEFESILHRINLGQSLAGALLFSTQRFASPELDLMRRAVAIQAEVGGSLAELLEKTNSTLRERLKLARQLKVITAQSRLSAQIVGILPIVLAVALNYMSPGYMQLLWDDKMGQNLLLAAVVLQIVGIFVMNRMSTMRV